MTSQHRYLPFGGLRTDVSTPDSSSTDFGYTGQRNLDEGIGLMDYRARFYSPLLNRFIQPDSIVPNPINPQAFNKYSYVVNSPINLNDPTGHAYCDFIDNNNAEDCGGGLSNSQSSISNGGKIIKPKDERDDGGMDTDTDQDGYPNVPDPFADQVDLGTHSDPTCNTAEIVECFYSRGRLPTGDWILTEEQLIDLMSAVYYDINQRAWSPFDWYSRSRYDTPLWDGYGADSGNICISSNCYDRNEVNYLAQGMYSAKYEGTTIGLLIVDKWNEREYSHPASSGEKFWFEQGYEFYVKQAWFYYGDPLHIK